jgi:hypothetical protein
MPRCVALALACGVQAYFSPDYSDPGRLWNWLKTDGAAAEPSAEPSDTDSSADSSAVDDLFKPHKEGESNPFLPSNGDSSPASDFLRHSRSGVDDLFKPHGHGHHHEEGGEFEPLSKDDLFKPHKFGEDAPARQRDDESSDAESSDSSSSTSDAMAPSAFSADVTADSGRASGSANNEADGSVVVTVPLDSQFLQGKKKQAAAR